MKKLVLLRHGDSPFNVSDFTRDLSEAGVSEAKQAARKIKNENINLDLIIHSEALRTTRTANIVGEELGLKSEKIIPYNELYNSTMDEIVSIIREQNDSFKVILCVGHNPGISELSGKLKGNIFVNLGTGDFEIIDLKVSSWSNVL